MLRLLLWPLRAVLPARTVPEVMTVVQIAKTRRVKRIGVRVVIRATNYGKNTHISTRFTTRVDDGRRVSFVRIIDTPLRPPAEHDVATAYRAAVGEISVIQPYLPWARVEVMRIWLWRPPAFRWWRVNATTRPHIERMSISRKSV